MHILLFILYGAIACYAISRIPFFKASGIRPRMLLLLFVLRVAVGCLHNWIAWRYFPNHGDVWTYFQESLVTRQELFTDFHRFLADNSVWAYMPYNTIQIMNALLDLFSFDNLYINTLFFSFLVFWGSIALFRVFRDIFQNDLLTGCCTLLIPSTLFWTACIHKDGLVYLLLGFFFYHFHRGIRNGWTPRLALGSFLLFLAAVFFRANTVVTALPALFIWVAAEKWPARRIKIGFAGLVVVVLLLFILQPGLLTRVLQYIVYRQQEFLLLKGNSALYLPALEPTFGSFLHILPVAILNGFFQPLPGAGGQSLYLVFSIEIVLIWLVIFYSLVRSLSQRSQTVTRGRHSIPSDGIFHHSDPSSIPPDVPPPPQASPPRPAFSLFCLLFAFTGMLIIGYTVPFAGTIVRYRSICLPFLLAPFVYCLRNHPLSVWLTNWLYRLLMRPGA